MSDPHHASAAPQPRGFAYFCEETLRYTGGARAWLFFIPYLLGAIWLEPLPADKSIPGLSPWLVLMVYLLVFPPAWRALLLASGLWRKRSSSEPPRSAMTLSPHSATDLLSNPKAN